MSVLMGSNSVAHFNPVVENCKDIENLMSYIKSSFVGFDNWLATEPNPVPVWNIHWISGKMSRGENQTWSDFQKQVYTDASDYFWSCTEKQKYIMLVCNKIQLPVAYQNLRSITIINDARSHKFLRKSVWNKHYGIKQNKIYMKINDSTLYPEPTRTIMQQFNNPVYIDESIYKFYRRVIWENSCTDFFSNTENFKSKKNLTVNLSDLLCQHRVVDTVNYITDYLNADSIDKDYIKMAHRHWINLHQFNF